MSVPPRRTRKHHSEGPFRGKPLTEEDVFAVEEKPLFQKRPPGLKVAIILGGVVIAVLLVLVLLLLFNYLSHLPSYDNKDLDQNL